MGPRQTQTALSGSMLAGYCARGTARQMGWFSVLSSKIMALLVQVAKPARAAALARTMVLS